jgi:hypothetical protein
LVAGWEEQLTEDQGGCCPVQEEVVPFYGGAYEASPEDLPYGRALTFVFSARSLHIYLLSREKRFLFPQEL